VNTNLPEKVSACQNKTLSVCRTKFKYLKKAVFLTKVEKHSFFASEIMKKRIDQGVIIF